MVNNYYEKVYAGFLGMNIGIRLGAPLEPTIWTEESIYRTYGEINRYVKDYINFSADDDANGPVYFLRALNDKKDENEVLRPKDVADAWLNYTIEHKGMFWWGGYGVSTEHTAYENLKNGIPAPLSGSIECNGKTVAEQIGGQIFIDTWGLIHPGDPGKAADDGEIAASVSHDGEGIYGARFICACIAEAFVAESIEEVIQEGLKQIPRDSLYHQVVECVLDFHRSRPDDFRECFRMLDRDWGYDKFDGICHIIPNAGVCALALIYGQGNFARSVEIAVMCGWDTDCNAGNVGTIVGVLEGLEGIPDFYRDPINDGIVLSGISGYLNILDIPTYVKEVAAHGYRMNQEAVPEALKMNPEEILFDFQLPGSTHNMRFSNPYYITLNPVKGRKFQDRNVLHILVDDLVNDACRIYYQSFYGRKDFSNEGYSPSFSPKAYPGQNVSISLFVDLNPAEQVELIPYVKTYGNSCVLELGGIDYKREQWFDMDFTIPDTGGDLVEEVGFMIRSYDFQATAANGSVYMKKFHIYGPACYSVDMKKQRAELGTITPFTVDGGNWTIEGDFIHSHRSKPAFAYTGNYFSRNYRVSALVKPLFGESHLLLVRANGAMMGYAAGFTKKGKIAVYKNDFGYELLKEKEFDWEYGEEYEVLVEALEGCISLYINDFLFLKVQEDSFSYGMVGFGSLSLGRTCYKMLRVEEM